MVAGLLMFALLQNRRNKALVSGQILAVGELITGSHSVVDQLFNFDRGTGLQELLPVLLGEAGTWVLVSALRVDHSQLSGMDALPIKVGNESWLGRDVGAVGQLVPQKSLLGPRCADYGKGLGFYPWSLDVVLDPLTNFEGRVPVSVETVLDVDLEWLKGRLISVRSWRRRTLGT